MTVRKPGRTKVKLAAILDRSVKAFVGKDLSVSPEDLHDAKGAHRTNKAAGCEFVWNGYARNASGAIAIHLSGVDTMTDICRCKQGAVLVRHPLEYSRHGTSETEYDVYVGSRLSPMVG